MVGEVGREGKEHAELVAGAPARQTLPIAAANPTNNGQHLPRHHFPYTSPQPANSSRIQRTNLKSPNAILTFAAALLHLFPGLLIPTLTKNAHADQIDVLLIPNWTTRTVWAFSPTDGSLISDQFIPDTGLFTNPRKAIHSGNGTVLVSDQTRATIEEFSSTGQHIRTVASPSTHGLDNIRGIAVKDNHVYVCVFAEPTNPLRNSIQRINLETGAQSTWTSINIASPHDIVFRSADALVSNSSSDRVERFGLNGNWFGTFAATGQPATFGLPIQITLRTNGNVLLASVLHVRGIHEYTAIGQHVRSFDSEPSGGAGLRAVWPLDNGQWLYTTNNAELGLGTLNTTTGVYTPIIHDDGFYGIARALLPIEPPPPPPPCPCDRDGDNFITISDYFHFLSEFFAQLGSSGSADLNNDELVTIEDFFQYLACLPEISISEPCPEN